MYTHFQKALMIILAKSDKDLNFISSEEIETKYISETWRLCYIEGLYIYKGLLSDCMLPMSVKLKPVDK